MNPIYKIFLARSPILAALFLVFFPIAVLWKEGIRLVFGGLFDLRGFSGFFFATCFAYLFSWSIVIILRITLMYGPERVGFSRPAAIRAVERDRAAQIFFFIGLLLPLPFLITSFVIGWHGIDGKALAGLLAGFLTALLIIFLADLIQRFYNSFHGDRTDSAKRLLFPFDNPLATWAEKTEYAKRIFDGKWAKAIVDRIRKLDPRFGQGYLRRKEDEVHIYPGHTLAIVVLLAYLLIYVGGLYFWNYPILDQRGLPMDIGVSTLASVFVLATLLLFLLSAISFFFDRYRIPPLLILALVVVFSDPDHRYDGLPIANDNRPKPEQMFEERSGDPFIVLVSAIGGGIQASAWAAEILTGFDEACQKEVLDGSLESSCADRIAVISGVSGGSVGAMYFMERYRGVESGAQIPNTRIKEYAHRSSLDFVGSSIIFDDLPRQIPSVSSQLNMDRGQQLARGWIYNQQRVETDSGNSMPSKVAGELLLSEWHRKKDNTLTNTLEKGSRRPAFIFGTTVVETGERILISTAKLNADNLKPYAARSLDDLVGIPTDVKIVDAVRLSSAFAFVSPAARMKVGANPNEASDFHLVDGGYHDNPGLLAVRDFVAEGITGLGGRKPRIAVIQIVGEEPETVKSADRKSRLELIWFKQMVAPLNVFWNVTWTVQSTRTAAAEAEIADLAEKRGGYDKSDIGFFKFPFKTDDGAPLSWHLTSDQQNAIREKALKAFNGEQGAEWSRLREFLKAAR